MSTNFGLLMSEEKSVIAPMPKNTKGGYQP